MGTWPGRGQHGREAKAATVGEPARGTMIWNRRNRGCVLVRVPVEALAVNTPVKSNSRRPVGPGEILVGRREHRLDSLPGQDGLQAGFSEAQVECDPGAAA